MSRIDNGGIFLYADSEFEYNLCANLLVIIPFVSIGNTPINKLKKNDNDAKLQDKPN